MYVTDWCVVHLVKGCILRVLEEYEQAKTTLLAVIAK